MEMRRNHSLSPQSYDLTQFASRIPEPLMWLHICVKQNLIQQNQGIVIVHLSHLDGRRGSRWSFGQITCGLEKTHSIDTWL